MKVTEIIPDKCWTVHDFLSQDECQDLIDRGVTQGIENKQATGDIRHRNNCRILLEDPDLASLMWERI